MSDLLCDPFRVGLICARELSRHGLFYVLLVFAFL